MNDYEVALGLIKDKLSETYEGWKRYIFIYENDADKATLDWYESQYNSLWEVKRIFENHIRTEQMVARVVAGKDTP